MTGFFANRRLIGIILALEILIVGASAYHHSLHGDEAWLGEQAYFLATDGYAHSNFFKGFNHQDEEIVVYHRLFIASASTLFNVFGFGLATIRIIPVVSGILLLLLLWYFSKRSLGMTTDSAALVLLVFLMIPQVFYFIKIARPEMMLTLFGFASFACLFQTKDTLNWKYILLAGICAGAAMLTHLNGAIFIGTGIVFLAMRKKFLAALVFGIAATVVLSPYIYDIATNFELFKMQMTNPYVASKTQLGILSPLVNLSREHQRLFRKPEIIFPMCLFLISMIAAWRDENPREKFIRTYTIILMVIFGMLVEDKTVKYSTCLAPFWALTIVSSIPHLRASKSWWKCVVIAFTIAFIICSVYYQSRDLRSKDEYVELNRRAGAFLPDGAWCVGPLNFIFNEIGHVNIISNELVRLETSNKPTADNLAAFCDRKQAAYLVFNRFGERIDDMSDLTSDRDHALSLFDIVVENSDFTILRRKQAPQIH